MHSRLFSAAIFFFLMSTFAFSQSTSSQENSYVLQADEVYGIDNQSYRAVGNVVVTFRNSRITADMATYYPATDTLEAIGNITVKDSVQELKADKAIYYLNSETGRVFNASGILNGEYYVCAENIDRIGKEYYIMEGVRITTCSRPLPDWSFSFKKATATVEGYLIGDQATGNILDMPVIYSPKLFYPLKFERQTGFLIPSLGYDSNFGMFFNEDFFWAMDIDKDLTVGINAFSSRGVMGTAEFRYAVSPISKINMTAEGINDSDSSTDNNGRWRYTNKSLLLFNSIEFVADSNVVSDYMYMRDFSDFTTYDHNSLNRENVFHQYYHVRLYTPLADMTLYYKDDKKYNDTNTGYIENDVINTPSISLDKFNQDLRWFTVDYTATADKILYKNDTFRFDNNTVSESSDYVRYDLTGSVYRSFKLPFMQITPSTTLYYTQWDGLDLMPSSADIYDPSSIKNTNKSPLTYLSGGNGTYERMVQEFSIKANLNEIYRYYGKSKHSILNTFEYVYIDDLDQTGLPNHLINDRIEQQNELKWALRSYYANDNWTTSFTARQGVNFNSVNNQPLSPLELTTLVSKKNSFSNSLKIELDYYGDTDQNGNKGNIAYFNDSLWVTLKPITISGSYTFDRDVKDNNTTVTAGLSANFKPLLASISNTWNGQNELLSFKKLFSNESRLNLSWQSQCWTAGMIFKTKKYNDVTTSGRQLKRDYSIGITLALRGLGDSQISVWDKSTEYD